MEPFFLDGFNDIDDIFNQFGLGGRYDIDREGVDILYACYETPPYEGYAWVVFEKGGKLYEVNGSHCSCMGLEGQWEPEEVTVGALQLRAEQGRLTDQFPKVEEFIVWLGTGEPMTEVIEPKKARGKSVLKFRSNSVGRPKKDYLI